MIDYDELLEIAGGSLGALVEITPFTKALCNSLLSGIDWRSFRSNDETLADDERDNIENLIAVALTELNSGTPIYPPLPEENFFGTSTPTTDGLSTGNGNVGMRFAPLVDGVVTGIKLFRHSTTGTGVTGALWELVGFTTMGTVTIADNSAGWVTQEFSSPIPVYEGQTYVISAYIPGGNLPYKLNYFTTGISTDNMYAFADGEAGNQGRYNADSSLTFPNLGFMSINFFVDVLFQPGS